MIEQDKRTFSTAHGSRTLACLLLTVLSMSGCSRAAPVEVHPIDPSEGRGAPYRVLVGEVEVPLERVGQEQILYYARFFGPDRANVTVTLDAGAPTGARVTPEHNVERVRHQARSLDFTLRGHGARLVEWQGVEVPPLAVILEPPEVAPPRPGDPGVFDLRDHGLEPGDTPQTDVIQSVLDMCAALPNGGIVYCPPGRYRTGMLKVGDNTRLYLAGGAVLEAAENPAAFPIVGAWRERGDSGETHSRSRLLMFDGVRNAGVFGRGTLDGTGHVLRLRHDRRVQVLNAHDCHNLTIEGVTLRNSASWTMHLLHCDNVRVADVKVLADWDVPNTDGINPDSSRNVLVERVFCWTGDDAMAVKATNHTGLLRDVYNIVFRDSVVVSLKTALKCGTETQADIRNVLFENIDVLRSARGIALWMRDGGEISGIVFRNVRMELLEYEGESRSGQPFYLTVKDRQGVGRIRDVRIEKVTCSAPSLSRFEGLAESVLERITLEDVHLTVTPRVLQAERVTPLFSGMHMRNVVLRNVTIDWSQTDPGQWAETWDPDAPFILENVREIGR